MSGFRCWTSSGFTQIDGQYRNMALLSKGTLALTNRDAGICFADVPRTSGTPVIAWSSDFPVTRAFSPDGNFRLSANVEDVNKSLTYYVFDWPQLVSATSAGLRVYSPAGVLVFDAGMKWFKVTAVVGTGFAGDSASYRGYSARTYATAIASPAGGLSFSQLGSANPQGNATFVVNSNAQGTYVHADGFSVASVKYYRGAQITANTVPAPQGGGGGLGQVLLIDVTNY